MKTLSTIFALLLISSFIFAQPADLILTNGKIFTADSGQPYAQAIAIRGNRILAVGSRSAIEKLASAKTKRIDLGGKTVVPGFNDAHDHLGWPSSSGLSYAYTVPNPIGLRKQAVLDSVARLVKKARPNQWIHGMIGTAVLYDTSMRSALDKIAPNNPVMLQIWWGHGQVVNTKALQVAGLSDNAPDPVGGWYERHPQTHKITALHQNAQLPIWTAIAMSEPENLVKGLRSFAQEQLAGGITTVQHMGSTLNGPQSIRIFAEANLPQRVRVIAWPHTTPNGRKLNEWELTNLNPAPLTYISGIKYTIDGTPMEGNALRSTPYPDRQNWFGRLNYPLDTMRQILREALSSNRQLMMHITADSCFTVLLSMMKGMAPPEQWRSKRVRIEHNSVGALSADQQLALKDMGITLMHTPKFCMGSPLRSLLENGVRIGIAPDGTTNPFLDILMITTMQTDPKENLTREQAVTAYTRTNAYAEFAENTKGTLTKGMLADLAVLSQDIFTIPAQQLPETRSVLTLVDGKIVYQQPQAITIR